MLYQKFKPGIILQPFVECFYLWEHYQTMHVPMLVESPPNGYTAMVFNYGDWYCVENIKQGQELAPRCFLTGQLTTNYRLHLSGTIAMVGIVFKPAVFGSIFRIPMVELTNKRISLEAVFGSEIEFITEQIAEATCPAAKIAVLQNFLIRKITSQSFSLDIIDNAVDIILEKKGIIAVKDLVTQLGVNRRQFERKFIQKVGLSPKYYSRLKRLSYICSLLINHRNPDWQEVIYAGGFYDQSHFIKDFVEFIQQNPSLYYKQHQELINYLDR